MINTSDHLEFLTGMGTGYLLQNNPSGTSIFGTSCFASTICSNEEGLLTKQTIKKLASLLNVGSGVVASEAIRCLINKETKTGTILAIGSVLTHLFASAVSHKVQTSA